MTELDSINILLSVIGEAPISSFSDLEANEITDSALAQRTLAEVNTDVQAEGWILNSDHGVDIQPDAVGEYPLPGNVLRITFAPTQYADCQYVARGNRIWDRNKKTYKIADSQNPQVITADTVVSKLEWDELSHHMQQYITIRSARIYSDRFINSNVVFTYTIQDEESARAQLIRAEESTLYNNLLWGNDRGMGQGLGYVPAQGRMYRRS